MFKKQEPNFSKQIEEILSQTENRLDMQNFQNLARSIALFHISLKEQGLDKEEALIITRQYLSELFNSTRK